MATTITPPEQFSTINKPTIFTVNKDESGVSEIVINDYIKQMDGITLDVNVSDYYKPSINPAPIIRKSGETLEVVRYDSTTIARAVPAKITADGTDSPAVYIGASMLNAKDHKEYFYYGYKFLTDFKRIYYKPGDILELSAAAADSEFYYVNIEGEEGDLWVLWDF